MPVAVAACAISASADSQPWRDRPHVTKRWQASVPRTPSITATVLFAGDQRMNAGIADDPGNSGPLRRKLSGTKIAAEPRGREHHDHEHRIVEAQIADPVAGAESPSRRDDGDSVDPILQFAVGEGPALECDGAPVR